MENCPIPSFLIKNIGTSSVGTDVFPLLGHNKNPPKNFHVFQGIKNRFLKTTEP